MKGRYVLLTVLLVALLGAVFAGPRFTERFWPAFNQDQAERKLGLRIESVWVSSHELSSNVLSREACVSMLNRVKGERLLRSVPVKWGYFVVVRWDAPREDGTPLYSYLGKYTFRTLVKPAN